MADYTLVGSDGDVADAAATGPALAIAGLASDDHLYLVATAVEGPSSDTFTEDSAFTSILTLGTTSGDQTWTDWTSLATVASAVNATSYALAGVTPTANDLLLVSVANDDTASAGSLTITQLTAVAGDGSNLTSYTTASVTPTANALIVVCVSSDDSGTGDASSGPDSISTTLSGVSFTKVGENQYNPGGTTRSIMTVWLADAGATPGSGTLTLTFGADSQDGCRWSITEVVGWNDTGALADTYRQITSASGTAAGGSVTFATEQDASSRSIVWYDHTANEATTPGGTAVELGDTNHSAPVRGFAAHTKTSAWLGSYTATWATSANWGSIGLEILAATATDPAAVPTLSTTLAGVTFTRISALDNNYNTTDADQSIMSLFIADAGAAPGTGTVTADFGADTQSGFRMSIDRIAAGLWNDTGTIADAYVAANHVVASGTGTSGSVTHSLAQASTGSRTFAFVDHAANEAVSGGTDSTVLSSGSHANPVRGFATLIRTDAFQNHSATWTTSSRWGMIAVELAQSADASPAAQITLNLSYRNPQSSTGATFTPTNDNARDWSGAMTAFAPVGLQVYPTPYTNVQAFGRMSLNFVNEPAVAVPEPRRGKRKRLRDEQVELGQLLR